MEKYNELTAIVKFAWAEIKWRDNYYEKYTGGEGGLSWCDYVAELFIELTEESRKTGYRAEKLIYYLQSETGEDFPFFSLLQKIKQGDLISFQVPAGEVHLPRPVWYGEPHLISLRISANCNSPDYYDPKYQGMRNFLSNAGTFNCSYMTTLPLEIIQNLKIITSEKPHDHPAFT